MSGRSIRFSNVAPGRPYHAAYVPIRSADFDMHRHYDYCEMFYVKNGSGQHCLPSGPIEISAGDLVLVWQHHEHGFNSRNCDQLELVNVAFRTDLMTAFLRLAEIGILFDTAHESRPLHARLASHERNIAASAFDEALSVFDRSSTALDLVRFWSETLPLLVKGRSTAPTGRPTWLTQVCLAMEAEENLQAGLPRMLELAGMSHGHLARSMRRHYGTTPVGFLTDIRVGHAMGLLRQTDLPVAEISVRCGFASPSYFSKQFRRAQGMSPRSFREQARAAVVPRG